MPFRRLLLCERSELQLHGALKGVESRELGGWIPEKQDGRVGGFIDGELEPRLWPVAESRDGDLLQLRPNLLVDGRRACSLGLLHPLVRLCSARRLSVGKAKEARRQGQVDALGEAVDDSKHFRE